MILKLKHTSLSVAKQIHHIFQISYTVEATLLKAENFPPLQRKLNEFVNSQTIFYGYYKEEKLAGVIEISEGKNFTHIQSLVVDPAYFRQGIASELLQFSIQNHFSKRITVETGLANKPAKKLYTSFGFKKVREWNTNHGVRKIAFEKEFDNRTFK